MFCCSLTVLPLNRAASDRWDEEGKTFFPTERPDYVQTFDPLAILVHRLVSVFKQTGNHWLLESGQHDWISLSWMGGNEGERIVYQRKSEEMFFGYGLNMTLHLESLKGTRCWDSSLRQALELSLALDKSASQVRQWGSLDFKTTGADYRTVSILACEPEMWADRDRTEFSRLLTSAHIENAAALTK